MDPDVTGLRTVARGAAANRHHQKEITMCYPVTCTVCGKTTWDGCGEHVDSVKASVPAEQWCGGEHDAA